MYQVVWNGYCPSGSLRVHFGSPLQPGWIRIYINISNRLLLYWNVLLVQWRLQISSKVGGGPGGGGHVSLGPVHHPRKSLSEKYPKRGWSDDTHTSLTTTPCVRTGVSLPNFLPFPLISRIWNSQISRTGPVREICEFHILFFSSYFTVQFSISLTRYARYAPGGEKQIPFLRVFIYADGVQDPMRHAPGGGGKNKRLHSRSATALDQIQDIWTKFSFGQGGGGGGGGLGLPKSPPPPPSVRHCVLP